MAKKLITMTNGADDKEIADAVWNALKEWEKSKKETEKDVDEIEEI